MPSTVNRLYHSYLNDKKFNYKWIIHKFSSSNMKIAASFCSPTFTFCCSPAITIKGQLECCPKYDSFVIDKSGRNGNAAFVCIGIRKLGITNQEEDKKVSIKISLLQKEEKKYKEVALNLPENIKLLTLISHQELIENKKILLPDDNLTILCEIKYVECKSNMMPENVTFDRIETKLNNDLASLFENGKYCDVTLVADGHKCILASRSDVFAAMFEHEMEESKTNRVIISDCNHQVLKEMLRYIYTGKAPNLNEMATELLAVSEKYGLENLKNMCENKLVTRLSVDTVAETLLLADLYKANELKKRAIHFMNMHAEAVTETAGWKKLVSDHFDFIAEVCVQLFKKANF